MCITDVISATDRHEVSAGLIPIDNNLFKIAAQVLSAFVPRPVRTFTTNCIARGWM